MSTGAGDNLVQAARNALNAAMVADERVIVVGEDVAEGGPFALTKGLVERHGAARVRNTPISEGAFMGAGVGMALAGARPFVDIMFNDFITAASDQLFNNAAKIHFMSGGRYSVPLTVWTLAGAGTRWGAHHSQHLDGWLAQVPGLKVLAPCTPAMASASVRAALEDPDPVVLLVDRELLYSRQGLAGDNGDPWSPRIVAGGSDLTLATSGRLVHTALAASAQSGFSVEVIDLQRLAPLAIEAIVTSVEKTNRLLIVHDEASSGSFASAVAAAVYERAFWALDAPVGRLTAPATPVPAAARLEDAYMVDAAKVTAAIRALMG